MSSSEGGAYAFLRPLLFRLPPETAHRLAMGHLRRRGHHPAACRRHRERALRPLAASQVDLSTECAGLHFAHPIALAAGLDKDAEAVAGLFSLGFSGLEVGTVTPRPQPGNPRPRLFRLPRHQALINRMGFNNEGAEAAAHRLQALSWRPGPVGVNLGKNKDTPLENATEDYLRGVEQLGPLGDYVVVNASSPNTPGLRSLQDPEQLQALLRAVRGRLTEVAGAKPLFLKIAPDLALEAVDEIVEVAVACGIQGLICTNTTVARPVDDPRAGEAGGLSGAPLRGPSTQVLARAYRRAGGRLGMIGVGGVMTAEDAYEKLRAGAQVVQLYTGFVYGGPGTVGRMVQGLTGLLARDGFTSVRDAIGTGP